MIFSGPLVGMRHRQPVPAIVAALSPNHPVTLQRQPDNPYDPNALAVYVAGDSLPEEVLAEALGLAQLHPPLIMLGFIAREKAAIIAPVMDRLDQPTAFATFLHNPLGGYLVEVDLVEAV